MKKLMLIATIAIVLCSSATEIKLADIFTPAARPQLTNGQWKATCEIAKFPSRIGSWTEFGKVQELCKDNETVRAEFDEMFAECYSTQNIGSYANKFCECARQSAINALNEVDKDKAQNAFDDARAGTFKNLIQKGKSAAFNECY